MKLIDKMGKGRENSKTKQKILFCNTRLYANSIFEIIVAIQFNVVRLYIPYEKPKLRRTVIFLLICVVV